MLYYSNFLTMIQNLIHDESTATAALIMEWTNLSLDALSKKYDWRQLNRTTTITPDANGIILVPPLFQRLKSLQLGDLSDRFYQGEADRSNAQMREAKYWYRPAGHVLANGSSAANAAAETLQTVYIDPAGQMQWYLYDYNDDAWTTAVLMDYYMRPPPILGTNSMIPFDCIQTLTRMVLQWAFVSQKYDADARALQDWIDEAIRLEIGNEGSAKKRFVQGGIVGRPSPFAFSTQRRRNG